MEHVMEHVMEHGTASMKAAAIKAAWLCAAALTAGCPQGQGGERPTDWWDRGSAYDVEEPVEFTDINYDFTGTMAIGDLPAPPGSTTWFGEDDAPADGLCGGWSTTPDLPVEITGIVTLQPAMYFKTTRCTTGRQEFSEKYYGSYFIQDGTGGHFVLGDSKVAHFAMGDRVTMRVRAIENTTIQRAIKAHDIVEVTRGPEPVYYQRVQGVPLGVDHVSRVVRVGGVVANVATTFGEIYLCNGPDPDFTVPQGGERPACSFDQQYPAYKFSLDSELTRRDVAFDIGTELEVTGPVLYNFQEYSVVVLRVGQITEL